MTTPTRIKCPYCLHVIELEQHVQEQSWRELYVQLGGLGDSWGRAFAYLQCCRKAEAGRAPVKTMTKLASELKTIWASGRFFYGGAEHLISRPQLIDGMEACIEKGLTGLKNNNYLKQILIGKFRETRREEGKAEAVDNRRKADQAATRPQAEPEQMVPVTEQPPESQVLFLATIYQKPHRRALMADTADILESNLDAAGVDLDKLRALARKVQNLSAPGLGPDLLRKCQKETPHGKNN